MFPFGFVGLAVVLPRSMLGLGLCILFACRIAAPAPERDYRDPSSVPPSWTRFAGLVQDRFETWISADEPIANRFRTYVEEHGGKGDEFPSSLVVKAWLDPDGTVERVSFPPLTDAQADADLHTLLTQGSVGEAPPQAMLQPLNMRFSLNLKN